jgi:ribonucleoside-triphosphate reductase
LSFYFVKLIFPAVLFLLQDNKDHRASGGNPCLEQTLESYELCCLVETFPNRHSNLHDFLETLKYAFLYAKTVTLGGTHWPETNAVMLRNRRVGASMSGIAQFVAKRGWWFLISNIHPTL